MEGLILDIRRQPDRFRQFDAPARRHFSDVLPYAIICLDEPDRVWIVAVMHMKRRPGYWRDQCKIRFHHRRKQCNLGPWFQAVRAALIF